MDNPVNWKNHPELIIPTLSAACYVVTSMVNVSNMNTLKSSYYAYFHCYKILNNCLGQLFQQWKDFHFTKGNYQNYGC